MSERWTDDRTETCKRVFLEGFSCAEVARRLGPGFTRNMVISKISRLGLSAADRTLSSAVPARPKAAAALPAPARPVKTTVPPAEAVVDRPAPAQPIRATPVVDLAARRPLTPASIKSCQWPVGDPAHSDFHMCGKQLQQGRPYCTVHTEKAFVPRVKKTSARELERGLRRYA